MFLRRNFKEVSSKYEERMALRSLEGRAGLRASSLSEVASLPSLRSSCGGPLGWAPASSPRGSQGPHPLLKGPYDEVLGK